jgi:hypothetical protein
MDLVELLKRGEALGLSEDGVPPPPNRGVLEERR